MKLNASSKIFRNADTVYHEDAGSVYILDEKHDEVVTLNPTGAYIWNNISPSGISHELLVTKLQEKFTVNKSIAAKDVEDFVSQLVKRGILKIQI